MASKTARTLRTCSVCQATKTKLRCKRCSTPVCQACIDKGHLAGSCCSPSRCEVCKEIRRSEDPMHPMRVL